jgi:hypothetical protein
MKHRAGFVSNSSSSCYIIALPENIKLLDLIKGNEKQIIDEIIEYECDNGDDDEIWEKEMTKFEDLPDEVKERALDDFEKLKYEQLYNEDFGPIIRALLNTDILDKYQIGVVSMSSGGEDMVYNILTKKNVKKLINIMKENGDDVLVKILE